jgi:hypothetical protein
MPSFKTGWYKVGDVDSSGNQLMQYFDKQNHVTTEYHLTPTGDQIFHWGAKQYPNGKTVKMDGSYVYSGQPNPSETYDNSKTEKKPEKPQQNGTSNSKKGSTVEAIYKPEDTLFFRPDTSEFIMVPAKDITAFEKECNKMDKVVDDFHKANEKYDTTLESLEKLVDPHLSELDDAKQARLALDAAIKEQQAARIALKDVVKPLAKMDMGHSQIVELIPIYKDKKGNEKRVFRKNTARYTAEKDVKNAWQKYVPEGWKTGRDKPKGTAKEQDSGQKSFMKSDANGGRTIDKDELKKGLSKIKVKWPAYALEEHAVTGVLFDWADAWNKELKYDYASSNPDAKLAKYVDLNAEAQMMRYLAGVGLEAEFDPKKARCKLKASARAEFAVAEAKASAALYLPDRLGQVFVLPGFGGKNYPMGIFRGMLEIALSGMAGASLVVEAGVQVDFSKEGKSGNTTTETREQLGIYGKAVSGAGAQRRALQIKGQPVDPSLSAEGEAFVGARADLKLSGYFQWMSPESKDKKFTDLAVVSPSISGQLGAGAGFQFEITYAAGAFRMRFMASACLGIGAKGKLEFTVNIQGIVEFLKWIGYQLYHANYDMLGFISKAAFDIICQVHLLVAAGIKKLEDFAIDMAGRLVTTVDNTIKLVNDAFDDYLKELDKEDARVKLMQKIIDKPALLIYAPPESKGMMLYQLTRHNWKTDGLDSRNHKGGYYAKRKEAVKIILQQAQTKRDFDNIIQHMTSNGRRGVLDSNRKHVMNFLDMSIFGDAKQDNQMDDFYNNLQAMLKDEPTRGWPMAPNDSIQYALQRSKGTDHTMYACLQDINMASMA